MQPTAPPTHQRLDPRPCQETPRAGASEFRKKRAPLSPEPYKPAQGAFRASACAFRAQMTPNPPPFTRNPYIQHPKPIASNPKPLSLPGPVPRSQPPLRPTHTPLIPNPSPLILNPKPCRRVFWRRSVRVLRPRARVFRTNTYCPRPVPQIPSPLNPSPRVQGS